MRNSRSESETTKLLIRNAAKAERLSQSRALRLRLGLTLQAYDKLTNTYTQVCVIQNVLHKANVVCLETNFNLLFRIFASPARCANFSDSSQLFCDFC